MTTLTVSAEQPYQVRIGRGVRRELPGLLERTPQVAVIHSPVLADRVEELVEGFEGRVTRLEVPDGEQAKTAEVLVGCWERLADEGFTRSDAVVGFGGGAITDLAGFVAASYLRGVRSVTVPSSVLGMVDAAVGGKTGINLPTGKNLVGAFHEPLAVLCDLELLTTLPAAELRSGLAEVVKCGFIADPTILELIEADPTAVQDRSSERLAEVITRGVAVKAEVVSGDLRERTSAGRVVGRELLNYGHTIGHAIERASGYAWRHGDAISVGMCFAAVLAHRLGMIDDALRDRHFSVLRSVSLPTTADFDFDELREAMSLDKKSRGSLLRFVLLDGLASAEIVAGPPESELASAWSQVRAGH